MEYFGKIYISNEVLPIAQNTWYLQKQQACNMAFIDIEDFVKREQSVQDYIKNLQEIKKQKTK